MASPPRIVLCACLLVALPAAAGLRPRQSPPTPTPDVVPHVPGVAAEDQKKLERALEAKDGPALLDFFRRRTPDADAQTQARALVRQLGDDNFAVRKQALEKLAARGPGAAALLRQARRSDDPEVARRAAEALSQGEQTASTSLLVAAIKQLAEQPPAETAAVLLAYLPWAEDEAVAEAVPATLARLAQNDRRSAERLVKTLSDADPLLRAAAAASLGGPQTSSHHDAVRKLLRDREPIVRAAAARALLASNDRAAVATLLAQLPELSESEAWQLLDLLSLAESPPPVGPGRDAEGRRLCRDAWSAWWRRQGETADLAALTRRQTLRGRTVLLVVSHGAGQALFLDTDGKMRGRLEGLEGPLSVEWVAADRLLVAEYDGRRVRELDTKNDEVWKYEADRPVVSAQRLSDNITLVACRNRVLKVDVKGKEVWRHQHPTRSIAAARAAADGTVVILTDDGTCVLLDDKGKERHRFATGSPAPLGCGFEVLPSGSILVPCHTLNCVKEFDPKGEVIWEISATQPTCVRRLPGGRTLIGSTTEPSLVEVDRQGGQRWSHAPEGKPIGVDRQ